MALSEFIRTHHDSIISDFAAFAKTLMPPGVEMTDAELRDHAKELLTAIVEDIRLPQTTEEQHRKARGRGDERTMEASGRLHAADRMTHGYGFESVLAEFRALRASVLRLYEESGATDLQEVRRFNEAIDEALTESMRQFANESDLLRRELDANAEHNTSLVAEIAQRRTAEERITSLFGQLVSAQDEERRRISRDIHDRIGQQMTALKMRLEILHASRAGQSGQRDDVGLALQLVEEIDRSLTSLTAEPRPTGAPENFGLVIALRNLVTRWSEQFGIAAGFQGPEMTLRLPLDLATHLYMLVQEALHNIVKHAGACNVSVLVQVQRNHTLVIVEDDGRGFDPSQPAPRDAHQGLGLTSMRERAELCGGVLNIESAPGRGTTIMARIPLISQSFPQDPIGGSSTD